MFFYYLLNIGSWMALEAADVMAGQSGGYLMQLLRFFGSVVSR
jgi:hypothetical protein